MKILKFRGGLGFIMGIVGFKSFVFFLFREWVFVRLEVLRGIEVDDSFFNCS